MTELAFNSNFELIALYNGYEYELIRKTIFTEIANKVYAANVFGRDVTISFYSNGEAVVDNSMAYQYFSATAVENTDGTYTITLAECDLFEGGILVLSSSLDTLTAVVGGTEVVFEKPLSSLVANAYWSDQNTFANMQFYTFAGLTVDCYDPVAEYTHWDVPCTMVKNADGTYTITVHFEGESFIDNNTLTLSADATTITYTSNGVLNTLTKMM